MEQGRRAHGFRRIVGMAHPDNAASIHVLEKLGLAFERMLEPDTFGVPLRLYATAVTE
jgi:RimJ/RimL family protein N-acetyltransferase